MTPFFTCVSRFPFLASIHTTTRCYVLTAINLRYTQRRIFLERVAHHGDTAFSIVGAAREYTDFIYVGIRAILVCEHLCLVALRQTDVRAIPERAYVGAASGRLLCSNMARSATDTEQEGICGRWSADAVDAMRSLNNCACSAYRSKDKHVLEVETLGLGVGTTIYWSLLLYYRYNYGVI